ncbi:MAG: hypothetical protein KC912_20255 [Proteobacteria bacterium]|nr:hypothetical protein [Pseudomonadota bacterium]
MLTLLSIALASPPTSLGAALDADSTLGDVPRGLRIVAVSNTAGGCAIDADVGCLERAVAKAVALQPYGKPLDEVEQFSSHGLYAAHLAIVLGEAVRAGLDTHAPLQEAIVEDLVAASRADAWHNPPSYAGDDSRWPADQAAVLYAIHLYDEAAADELLKAWTTVLAERGTDAATGLPVSELTSAHGYSSTPRGCALFWTVNYLAEVDPDYASDLMTQSTRALATQTPLGLAMREYPKGRDRAADWDSGPIVMGVGVASSAFALGGAHAVGRSELVTSLQRSERRVQAWIGALPSDDLRAAAHSTMAESIRYRWYPR